MNKYKHDLFEFWNLDRDLLTLTLDDPEKEIFYQIDLELCGNSAKILDWIIQLSMKEWITPELLFDFIVSLDELLDIQANICPFGENKTIDIKKILKGK